MPEFEKIGQNVLNVVGPTVCERAYGTTDPEWVGRYAIEYGDANEDWTLN